MSKRQRIQDQILVLRAQTSAEGFDALVARWQRALWTHAYRMTDDREAAWDLVQEAWITMIRSIGDLHDPGAFPAWAYRIVTNKCRNLCRKQGRRRRLLEGYAERVEQEHTAYKTSGASHEALDLALGSLPRELRMLLSLYYEEEFAVKEIAEILGINDGTVKSRLYRARQELRSRMEDMTDDH